MARYPRRETAPEMRVRSLLHAAGLRYRVHYPVPGNRRRKIDIAFTRVRLAIFIDGCFWHGCPAHGIRPRTNEEWWAWKLRRNSDRDRDTDRLLEAAGRRVLRVWEHQDPEQAVQQIVACVTELRVYRSP